LGLEIAAFLARYGPGALYQQNAGVVHTASASSAFARTMTWMWEIRCRPPDSGLWDDVRASFMAAEGNLD
jgi:hypothetical protein